MVFFPDYFFNWQARNFLTNLSSPSLSFSLFPSPSPSLSPSLFPSLFLSFPLWNLRPIFSLKNDVRTTSWITPKPSIYTIESHSPIRHLVCTLSYSAHSFLFDTLFPNRRVIFSVYTNSSPYHVDFIISSRNYFRIFIKICLSPSSLLYCKD